MSQLDTNTSNLEDILSTISALPNAVSVDEALSETSTNPVQNKVVTAAINNHTQAASTITAGTFTGVVAAEASSQTPATPILRNSSLVTTDTNPTNNGEICWTYE